MYCIYSRSSDLPYATLRIASNATDFSDLLKRGRELSTFTAYDDVYIVNLIDPPPTLPMSRVGLMQLAHYFHGECRYIIAHKDIDL